MIEELRERYIESLKQGIRFDGRKLDQYRKISIQYNITKNAEGSARVRIGETEVIVGVKMEIGEPFPDKPDEGTIMVGAELLPLSNPEFESGPPGIEAIELARVVDRGIRESKAIDFKKLCIEKGKKAWIIMIDIVTINDAGNLFDASSLAALAALKDTRFPKYDGEKVDYKTKTKEKITLSSLPLSVTVLKIGENFIIDPDIEEEKIYDARLTVATMDNNKLCALQKGGDYTLTESNISDMIEIAIKKTVELRRLL
jgi:exosome complex component RRP42